MSRSSSDQGHGPAQSQDRVPSSAGVSRRSLLFGGVTVGLGAAAAVGLEAFVGSREAQARADALPGANTTEEPQTIPFHGKHQAGIEMVPQAHQALVALSLRHGVDREGIRRLLGTLTDDAARLTHGNHALADSEPEMAHLPARLTVTFGFGRGLVDIVAPDAAPPWLRVLPGFGVDRLEEQWNSGDLLLQIGSDDPLTLAHAQRMLLKDARTFTEVKWIQNGFRHAFCSVPPGQTQRNLFGQLDGTVNMAPGTSDFASVVWNGPRANPDWLDGGTGFVIRRIEMQLDKWDRLDRPGREESVGRRLATGAPLTGVKESDEPDFDAKTPIGFPVIAEFSHIRRARSDDPNERIFRRTYNYDLPPDGDRVSNSGLIFTSFQHNVTTQFVPLQTRMDQLDLLNEWITPIGSAVFAIPPGCQDGGFIGETLFAVGGIDE